MGDWQPIETAPKDGTRILAFSAKAPGGPRIDLTWWRNVKENGYVGWGEFNETYWPATHWMPLPVPPTS